MYVDVNEVSVNVQIYYRKSAGIITQQTFKETPIISEKGANTT